MVQTSRAQASSEFPLSRRVSFWRGSRRTMSSLSLRLPESVHEKIRELAERDNISINQFIATAVAEKAAALLTVDYLETRARRADTKLLDRLLKRMPDVPSLRVTSAGRTVRRRRLWTIASASIVVWTISPTTSPPFQTRRFNSGYSRVALNVK